MRRLCSRRASRARQRRIAVRPRTARRTVSHGQGRPLDGT